MKNLRGAIIAILLMVLVCATFVACNDDNNPPANENGYQLMDKKPFAKPDPNNQFDLENENERADFSSIEFDGKVIYLTLTNSESLNNLFYNYKAEDFGVDKFAYIEDSFPDDLSRLRRQIFNSIEYDINDNTTLNPQTFTRTLDLVLINSGKENALRYIEELYEKNYVRRVVPDNKTEGEWFLSSSDTHRNEQWGLDKIDINNAWELTTGSSSVTVGLIDTGIRKTHEDLSANIADGGYADTSKNQNPHSDTANHGTRTAGIIGAVGNNGKGVSGVCWNVNIVSLKACIGSQQETPELLINAIEYATANGIKLLNYSGGIYSNKIGKYQDKLFDAIRSFNGLIVVAAGNENYNIDNVALYPQSFDLNNILVVGATDRYDNKASFSNYGSVNVDLFAPGEGIYSTSAGGDKTYGTESGTSLSAPFVTGVAALILAREPNLTAAQLKYRIMQNVDSVPSLQGKCVSGGRLNAKKAVEYTNHPHSKATLDYTNLGITTGHKITCNYCDYTVKEGHTWTTVGPTIAPKGYKCSGCGVFTKTIEIVIFDNVVELEGAFEKEAVLVNGVEMMAVSDDVAIIKGEDGRYYILVACDENGEIANDIVEDIKIPWLKDLIANEVSKVKDEKD